ncbi:uncharacterized protein RHO17_004130 [Thomomys bottae]
MTRTIITRSRAAAAAATALVRKGKSLGRGRSNKPGKNRKPLSRPGSKGKVQRTAVVGLRCSKPQRKWNQKGTTRSAALPTPNKETGPAPIFGHLPNKRLHKREPAKDQKNKKGPSSKRLLT